MFLTIYGSFAFFIFNTIHWANVAANICAEINLIWGNIYYLFGLLFASGSPEPPGYTYTVFLTTVKPVYYNNNNNLI